MLITVFSSILLTILTIFDRYILFDLIHIKVLYLRYVWPIGSFYCNSFLTSFFFLFFFLFSPFVSFFGVYFSSFLAISALFFGYISSFFWAILALFKYVYKVINSTSLSFLK